MADINPDYLKLDADMSSRELDQSPVSLLERIKQSGRVWDELCAQYGVDNPDPPWRVTLEATCDMLAEGECQQSEAEHSSDDAAPAVEAKVLLDGVERRWEEDQLVKEHYASLPFPENQLMALAHTLIRRGVMDENELATKMREVDQRLNMS
jgi:hypothetical protein